MEHIRLLTRKRNIAAVTCYDYSMAKIIGSSGVDMILVGDSLGMVIFGYENTHFVTLEDIIRHTQAVMRGNSERGEKLSMHSDLSDASETALVVADMPAGSCESAAEAIKNCRRVIEETGCHAVKIEGKPEIVQAVVEAGIEVLGHTGLKPQESKKFGLRGANDAAAKEIVQEAQALEKAGCFAIILECVPETLGKKITEILTIPVIGIGAGRYTDGQILVLYDMLGLYHGMKPRFVRTYADMGSLMRVAVSNFCEDVQQGKYPDEREVY